MKYLATLFLALFVSAVAVQAQTAPAVRTFSVSTTAVSLPGNKSSVVGSLDGITLGITQNLSLRQTNLISPGNLTGFYGGFDYNIAPFSKLLNNLSPQLNGYNFRLELTGSAGVDRVSDSSGTVHQHYSFLGGGRLTYAIGGSKTYSLIGEAQYAKLPGYANSTVIVSLGPVIRF